MLILGNETRLGVEEKEMGITPTRFTKKLLLPGCVMTWIQGSLVQGDGDDAPPFNKFSISVRLNLFTIPTLIGVRGIFFRQRYDERVEVLILKILATSSNVRNSIS